MIKLYEKLYRYGVSLTIDKDIGNPDTMRFIFGKGVFRSAYGVPMEYLKEFGDLPYLEQRLFDVLETFLDEYETELKRVRKETEPSCMFVKNTETLLI